jgi:hypothetical protein
MVAPRAKRVDGPRWLANGANALAPHLDSAAAVLVAKAAREDAAAELAGRVLASRERFTKDFGGDQFALGRAFYTHLETGRAKDYFANARASDALVEEVLPGAQERTLALLSRILGGEVRRRPGFCGPGVHVFPARGKVARDGGSVHFDLEGLTDAQKEDGNRAVTLVWMLQPSASGGGLRLWDVLYDGRPDSEVESDDHANVTVLSRAGDALLIDSKRLHQIRPFRGDRDRVSITVHAAEVDDGVWESWF